MVIPQAAMLQRTVTAKPEQPAPDPSTTLEGLGRGWLILRNCRLGRPQRGGLPSALIHPAIGVALLEILPTTTPDAVAAFRARLEAARFPSIFPGNLPVVHLRLAPRQLEELRERLESAFAAQPPLNLPGGDAWVVAVARALTTEPAVPGLRSRRFRTRRRRRSFVLWRVAGAVGLAAGVLAAVFVAAGNRQPQAPAAEAVSAASPPASGAGKAALPARQEVVAAPLKAPLDMTSVGDQDTVQPTTPPAPAVQAPAPAAPAQPSAPSAPDAVAAAPRETAPPSVERPSPPGRVTVDRAPRSDMSAAGTRAMVPTPRSAPPAHRSEPEASLAEKENPAGKPALLHLPPWHEASGPARLPPIAAPLLPPIASSAVAPLPEPPQQRCRRIVYLVGQGVLLPEEELQFFQRVCVRH